MICSDHGNKAECSWAYHYEFHVVWIPKYRKKILKGDLQRLVEKHLGDIQKHHPDIEIEKYSVQKDHVHLIIVIPPKYSVSEIIGKIKANTSREIRRRFAWVKKVYWHNEFWSPGFFSSTVGINEEVIKRYIEFQEKIDKGQLQLSFDLQCHGREPVGIYREDVLDLYLFRTLTEVRKLSSEWSNEYNGERPHESLNNMTPYEYLKTFT